MYRSMLEIEGYCFEAASPASADKVGLAFENLLPEFAMAFDFIPPGFADLTASQNIVDISQAHQDVFEDVGFFKEQPHVSVFVRSHDADWTHQKIDSNSFDSVTNFSPLCNKKGKICIGSLG